QKKLKKSKILDDLLIDSSESHKSSDDDDEEVDTEKEEEEEEEEETTNSFMHFDFYSILTYLKSDSELYDSLCQMFTRIFAKSINTIDANLLNQRQIGKC